MSDNKIIVKDQMPINEIMNIGKAFAESGMFPDIKSAAQAVVKIQAGQEMGIAPFAAMSGIHIIAGKPVPGAGIIASKVKSSGKYDYKVKEMSDKACVLDFYQGKELIGTSSFTVEDAKKAQTKNIDKFAKNMLFARAVSNGQKWFCPDVFLCAVYAEEDFNQEITEDTTAEVLPPEIKQPQQIGLSNPENKGLSEDELFQWQQSLNDCINIEEITKLYNSNKGTVNSEPQIFQMFKERKTQLA